MEPSSIFANLCWNRAGSFDMSSSLLPNSFNKTCLHASLLSYLPFTLEWNLLSSVLLIGALIAGRHEFLASIPLLVAVVWAAARAWRAKVDPRYDGVVSRLLITVLIYLGPLLRSLQRYLHRIQGATNVARIQFEEPGQRPRIHWRKRQFFLSYWSDRGFEKENLLHTLMEFLLPIL